MRMGHAQQVEGFVHNMQHAQGVQELNMRMGHAQQVEGFVHNMQHAQVDNFQSEEESPDRLICINNTN